MCALVCLAAAAPAIAQSVSEATEAGAVVPVVHEDDDAVLRPTEPDFVVVNLPAMKSDVSRADVSKLVHYVKTLRRQRPAGD